MNHSITGDLKLSDICRTPCESVGRSHFQSVPLFFPACTADMIMDMKDKLVEEVVDQVVMKVVDKITKA